MTIETPDSKPQYVNQIVNRIGNGDIKLPAFQREFVWKPNQVLDLFDSMLKAYPIGSVLLWRTDVPLAQQRDLGEFELPATPAKYPTNYVLDGQQRLTSIYGAFKYAGALSEENIFNIAYDLDAEVFVHPDSVPPVHWMPMNVLESMPAFLDFEKTLNESRPELVVKAKDVYDRLFQYSVPVVTIMAPEVGDVATIFERINSTGTRLTLFNLMVAATWSDEFFLRDAFDGLTADLKAKHFEGVSPVALLQILAADLRGSAKRQTILDLRKQEPGELAEGLERIAEAAKRTVDFLSTDLRVASSDFLPYERQFVALSHTFARSPKVSGKGMDALRR